MDRFKWYPLIVPFWSIYWWARYATLRSFIVHTNGVFQTKTITIIYNSGAYMYYAEHIIETTVTCNICNSWVHVIHLGRPSCYSDDCLEQCKALWSSKIILLFLYINIIMCLLYSNLIYLHCWTCLWHLFHKTWLTLAKALWFVWHASNPKCNKALVSVWERES